MRSTRAGIRSAANRTIGDVPTCAATSRERIYFGQLPKLCCTRIDAEQRDRSARVQACRGRIVAIGVERDLQTPLVARLDEPGPSGPQRGPDLAGRVPRGHHDHRQQREELAMLRDRMIAKDPRAHLGARPVGPDAPLQRHLDR